MYALHNYAIVDEVDSVLIDDARTPLIISGPVPKGDDQLFEQLRPLVERLVEAQKVLATKYLSEAKKLIASNDKKEVEEGFLALYRSHKALPKNKALIKFLSEQGIKAGMLKTEEIYMEQNNTSNREVGVISADGELSTRMMIFPSNTCAAAVSGRSENRNFGNGFHQRP